MSLIGAQPGTLLHHQLSTLLKDGIAAGRWQAGEQLPTEEALCSLHGLSRVTVRRALKSLEQQGFIERRPGRGTFVAPRAPVLDMPTPITGYLQRMAERRERSRHVLKAFEWVAAPPAVRLNLGLEPDARVLRVVRLRVMGRLPLVHSTLHLPEAIGARLTRAQFRLRPLSELLAEAGHAYQRIDMVTRACLAAPDVAAELQVAVASPLVDVRRVGYDMAGKPVEFQRVLGPPDRFETHVTIAGDADAAS